VTEVLFCQMQMCNNHDRQQNSHQLGPLFPNNAAMYSIDDGSPKTICFGLVSLLHHKNITCTRLNTQLVPLYYFHAATNTFLNGTMVNALGLLVLYKSYFTYSILWPQPESQDVLILTELYFH
jgi:hypothetical protein